MEAFLSYPRFLPLLAVLGYFLWQGVRRRRDVWSRGAWWRFATLLLVAVAALMTALRMGVGVDEGVYADMSPTARTAYFWTMTVLLLGGTLGTVGLLMWLAKGRPERELGRKQSAAGSGSRPHHA